ncbi:hypothetical protein PLEOSDRAFT_175315 [Pleurotus ostreatus PC15]|uniref:BTB domain-containing protein n=1 Tax=Pleurotus ostreatus (strain PC15) TaxID=1137138 RepID=A0A067NYD4_PLEO1|nr:hypothetical protein PLEOSDRAFT_175315 [Pleurotus ostreatus PC15]
MSASAGTPKATPTKPATANSSPAPPNFFNTPSDTPFTWNQSGKNTAPVPLTSGTAKTPAAATGSSAPGATTDVNAKQSASSATQPFKFNILTSPRVTMSAPSPSVSSTPVALTKVPTMPPVRKHDTYYFADGSVIIQVGEVLFNLHQSILTLHSKQKFVELGLAFRTYSAPLVLKGVNLKDFECLLCVLYPQNLGIEEETRTVEQWVSIMKQAHMWDIEPLKQRAAKHLSTMTIPPAERVNLYQNCAMGTSPDLLPALLALSQQEAPVGLEDARLLGLETFTKLVRIRERRLMDVARGIEAGSTKTLLRGLIQEDILGLCADNPTAQTALEVRGSPNNESSPNPNTYSLSALSLPPSPPSRTPSTSSSASSNRSSVDGLDDAVKVEKPARDDADDSGDSDAFDASDASDED